jgi:hypothetical protein
MKRGSKMRKSLLIVSVAVAALVGCGGTGAQGKTALAAAASEQNGIKIDSVDVFSRTANVMVKVPYSELVVKFSSISGLLEVVGTVNGAIAEYFFGGTYPYGVEREDREPPDVGYEPLEVELDKEAWYVFFNALHNSGIRRWEREYYSPNMGDVYSWGIYIYTKGGDTLISSFGVDRYPPNKDEWFAFRDIIDSFIEMMKEKKQKLREMEYTKRFGRPMSEYERSVKQIFYYHGTTLPITVELKASGEVVSFNGCSVRLDIDDWLDIINALGHIIDGSINKNNVDTTEVKEPMWGSVGVYDSTRLANREPEAAILDCYLRYDDDNFTDTASINKCINSLPKDKPIYATGIGQFPASEELKNIMDGISAGITCEE